MPNTTCPYAVQLDDDEDSCDENVATLARKSCPAFASSSCPFSNKTPEEVRQTLAQIPPSHYKQRGKDPTSLHFQKALEQLHNVSPNVSEEFHLAGGCPVQKEYRANGVANIDSFSDAMEQFSLSAVISRMVSDLETHEQNENENTDAKPAASPTDDTTESTAKRDTTDKSQACLSQAFKSGTAVSHQAAEDVHFVKNFIRGEISRSLYADLVLSLYHVYHALEDQLDQHGPQHFGNCHFPHELCRRESLKEDVDFWHGSLPTSISPATQDYMDRLAYLGRTNPLLLLAHAYTRYLGDLSGGKVLARVARRAMGLGKDGLAFYEFENVASAKLFKDKYRQSLDDLELSSTQIQQLVEEANVAFVLNMRLFEELDVKASVPGSKVRPLQEALDIASAPSKEGAKEECPFMNVQKNDNDNQTEAAKRCPWPFIFAHDWRTGMKDYQTWVVIGLLLSLLWNLLKA